MAWHTVWACLFMGMFWCLFKNSTAIQLLTWTCHLTVYHAEWCFKNKHKCVYQHDLIYRRVRTRVCFETFYKLVTRPCKHTHGRVLAWLLLSKLINLVFTKSSHFCSIGLRLFCTSSLAVSFILLAHDFMIDPPS